MRILRVLSSGLTMVALAAAASFAATAAKQPAAPAAAKPPKYIRYSDFKLSFDFPAKVERDQPVEVQLHVSDDRGGRWEAAQKQSPAEKQFVFRAPKDGEYWFMCRTKYASGQYLPAAPPAPEIKIIVDTTQPVLELTALRGEGGEVHVCWSLSDANLAPETFKIAYQLSGPGKNWQNVAIDPPTVREPGQELKGEIAFLPQGLAGGAAVTVRAEVADRAGNRAVIERPVTSDEAEGKSDRLAFDAGSPPSGEPAAGDSAAGPQLGAQESANEFPPEMADSFPGRTVSNRTAFPVSAGESPYPKTNVEDADSPAPQPALPPASQSRAQNLAPSPELKRQPTETERIHPPVADRYPPELPEALEGPPQPNVDHSTIDGELLPPGIHPHMVNKSQFELLYDVESVGAAGIAQIELWGTSDGGQHWLSYGLDDDARSPMLVKVDGEGIYGFRVVVKTGAGLEGAKPASGDPPDVWVGVDLTKPVGNLISAEQGSGDEAGELVICWEAADERLAPRPISLRMSESPEGPWHTIASGLDNTGRYAWRLDQRTPQRLFLRLEVRDEAGNIRIDDSTEPVTIERIRPQGRIRDVRSAGEASRKSRTTHNLLK
jgi:hypothetical protein